jgi:hypothetical protein
VPPVAAPPAVATATIGDVDLRPRFDLLDLRHDRRDRVRLIPGGCRA